MGTLEGRCLRLHNQTPRGYNGDIDSRTSANAWPIKSRNSAITGYGNPRADNEVVNSTPRFTIHEASLRREDDMTNRCILALQSRRSINAGFSQVLASVQGFGIFYSERVVLEA